MLAFVVEYFVAFCLDSASTDDGSQPASTRLSVLGRKPVIPAFGFQVGHLVFEAGHHQVAPVYIAREPATVTWCHQVGGADVHGLDL